MSNTRLIIKDRAAGKSTQLLYTSETTGYPIITQSEGSKNVLLDKAKALNLIIPEPITVQNWNYEHRGKRIEHVLVDDAESVIGEALKQYFDCDVIAATLTDKLKEFQIRRYRNG